MLNKFDKIDTLNENLIAGAELVGRYDFPVLQPVDYTPGEVIPFNAAISECKLGR